MVATLGAAALVVSLFATWYKLGLPADARRPCARDGAGEWSDEVGRQFGMALLDAFEIVDEDRLGSVRVR